MDWLASFAHVVLASAVAVVPAAAQQAASDAALIPRSELPVTLLGIVMDANAPDKSSCLVRCTYPGDTHTTNSFVAIGQLACGMAEITDILQETVVIKNLSTNRLERLAFPKTTAAPVDTPSPMPEPVAAPPPDVKSPTVITVDVRRDAITSSLANLPELLSSAVAKAHFRNVGNGQSVMEGFELTSIREGSAVGQLGVQDGDVILDVNGDKLNSPASILKLLSQVPDMTRAKLNVLRDGEPTTIVINIK